MPKTGILRLIISVRFWKLYIMVLRHGSKSYNCELLSNSVQNLMNTNLWNSFFETWPCPFCILTTKSLIISLLWLLKTYRCRILKRFVLLLLQNPSSFWLICFRLLFLTKKYLMFETKTMLIKKQIWVEDQLRCPNKAKSSKWQIGKWLKCQSQDMQFSPNDILN